MGAISFKRSSLENYNKYNSLLVGNEFTPPPADSSYDLLETTTLTSSASSVTFSGLGSYTDYKHLQIRAVARSSRSANADGLSLRINNVSSSSYTRHVLFADGSNVNSSQSTGDTSLTVGRIPASSQSSDVYGAINTDLVDAYSSTKNTTSRSLSGFPGNENSIYLDSGLFINTASITDLTFFATAGPNLVTGSRFSLFGIRG